MGLTVTQFVTLIDQAEIHTDQRKTISFNHENREYCIFGGTKEELISNKELEPLSLKEIVQIGCTLENGYLEELKQTKGLSQAFTKMSQSKEVKEQSSNFLWRLIIKIVQCVCNFFQGLGFQTTAEAAADLAKRLATEDKDPPIKSTVSKSISTRESKSSEHSKTKSKTKSETVSTETETEESTESRSSMDIESSSKDSSTTISIEPETESSVEIKIETKPEPTAPPVKPPKEKFDDFRVARNSLRNADAIEALRELKVYQTPIIENNPAIVYVPTDPMHKRKVTYILEYKANPDKFGRVKLNTILQEVKSVTVKTNPSADLAVSFEGLIQIITGKQIVDFNDPIAVRMYSEVLKASPKTFQIPILQWLLDNELFTPSLLKLSLDIMLEKCEKINQFDPYSLDIILSYYLSHHFNYLVDEEGVKLLPSNNESVVKALEKLIDAFPSNDGVQRLAFEFTKLQEYDFAIFSRLLAVYRIKEETKNASKIIENFHSRDVLVADFLTRKEWHHFDKSTEVTLAYVCKAAPNSIIAGRVGASNMGECLESLIQISTGKENIDFNDPVMFQICSDIIRAKKKDMWIDNAIFEWLLKGELLTPALMKNCLEKCNSVDLMDLDILENLLNYYLNHQFNEVLSSTDDVIVKAMDKFKRSGKASVQDLITAIKNS